MIQFLEDPQGDDSEGFDLEHAVASVFESGGWLEKVLDFDHRDEQEEMARAVSKSLVDGEHLLFEAGTGVGKSLAYLVPSLLFSKTRKRPCVIATNTISLQEQLLGKDVPALRDLLAGIPALEEMADFRCALLVGRANYLCTTRLQRTMKGQGDLFEGNQRAELHRIAEWAGIGAKEGIRQELSPSPMGAVWDAVNADSSICSSKRCSPDTCFYRRARAEVERADLIIVNHSLLFALMGAGFGPGGEEGGVMFANDFVIFDEAHEMPYVASEHLGISISSWALEMSMRKIYNSKKRKGLLAKVGGPNDWEIVENAELAVADFFQYIHLKSLGNQERIRLREAGVLPLEVFPPLSRLCRRLVEVAEVTEDESLKIELKDQAKRMQGYLRGLSEIVELKDEKSVYWLERTGKKNQIIHLRSAPLEIAEVLREQLFSQESSIVMTSATLTRKGKADSFKSMVGAESICEGIVNSPFDYESNLQIRIQSDCPEPTAQNREPYLKCLTEVIHACSSAIEGGTLALFTNYADLRHCYHALRPRWGRLGRSLYAQGEGYSRTELRNRLVAEGDVLLLGAESFWKGFDAKGACLSQVIITRLPFENPGHPLLEAKTELLREQGKSSFAEHFLPSAVIRFRQGIGRLIRSKTDVGDLVVLDSRILRKGYGKSFLNELPKKSYEIFSSDDLADWTD
jgi:ATP-dependent DNA helicase DinG